MHAQPGYRYIIIIILFILLQVLQFLEKLGLQKYCEIFATEKIDGAILVELDDHVLGKELGMGQLHKLKVLRVLDGRASLDSI